MELVFYLLIFKILTSWRLIQIMFFASFYINKQFHFSFYVDNQYDILLKNILNIIQKLISTYNLWLIEGHNLKNKQLISILIIDYFAYRLYLS